MSMQTRRHALQMGMSALAANASTPVLSRADVPTSASADAALICLCERWRATDQELDVLCETRVTIKMEKQTQKEYDRLCKRQLKIGLAIKKSLPPKTKQGVAVIAKLALDTAEKWNGDYHCLPDVCHHMAWDALAFLCGMENATVSSDDCGL